MLRLRLDDITCPTYPLAGETGDITTKEQVLDAAKYLGTPKDKIESKLVPGGHIGLFMGSLTLKVDWPVIARWICAVDGIISDRPDLLRKIASEHGIALPGGRPVTP